MSSFISKVHAKYDWEIDTPNGHYRNDPKLPFIGFDEYKNPEPMRPNETWWHGRENADLKFGDRIAFFTDYKDGAEFYTHNNSKGILIEAQLRPKKVATLLDLTDVLIKQNVTTSDIAKHSAGGGGENPNDSLYIPNVRKEMLNRGFDAVLVWDVWEAPVFEIRCAIILNPKCIHVLGYEVQRDGIWQAAPIPGKDFTRNGCVQKK